MHSPFSVHRTLTGSTATVPLTTTDNLMNSPMNGLFSEASKGVISNCLDDGRCVKFTKPWRLT